MTVKSTLCGAALAGVGLLVSPVSGVPETLMILSTDGAIGLAGPSQQQGCCSIEDSAPRAGLAPDSAALVGAAAGDANAGPGAGAYAAASREGPQSLGQAAAAIADPPQSALRRMLSALIQFGADATHSR